MRAAGLSTWLGSDARASPGCCLLRSGLYVGTSVLEGSNASLSFCMLGSLAPVPPAASRNPARRLGQTPVSLFS